MPSRMMSTVKSRPGGGEAGSGAREWRRARSASIAVKDCRMPASSRMVASMHARTRAMNAPPGSIRPVDSFVASTRPICAWVEKREKTSSTSGSVRPSPRARARHHPASPPAHPTIRSTRPQVSRRRPACGEAASEVTWCSSARAPAHASNNAPSATPLCPTPRRIIVSTPASRATRRWARGSRESIAAASAAIVAAAFVPVSQSAPSHPSRSSRKGASLAASSAPARQASMITDAFSSMTPLSDPPLSPRGLAVCDLTRPIRVRLVESAHHPLFCHGCLRFKHRRMRSPRPRGAKD